MLHIVLVEPEIPQNCGNIARTCAATGSRLHLVRPLGFDISDRAVKRAGLDYWHLVQVQDYDGLDDLFARHPEALDDLCRRTTRRRGSRRTAGCSSARRRRGFPRTSAWRTTTGACGCPCAAMPAA